MGWEVQLGRFKCQRSGSSAAEVHGWLHQTDDGITPKLRSDSKEGRPGEEAGGLPSEPPVPTGQVHPFQHEEKNHGVAWRRPSTHASRAQVTERRRELVERLNNERQARRLTFDSLHVHL